MTTLFFLRKYFQPLPRSNFIPAISPLLIILIVNLSAKSNQTLFSVKGHTETVDILVDWIFYGQMDKFPYVWWSVYRTDE